MFGPSLLDQIALWPWAEAATILFGFAWGAMLGSFINVVVHRLPRGESVVTKRSRCPRCQAAIRPSDNVPVLGWLWLKGRCRDCGGQIAASYPLVEGFCGLMVALLAAAELVAGGRWLPRLVERGPPGIDRLLRGDWQLLLAFALHAGTVLAIVCWSLLDGELASNRAAGSASGKRLWTVPIRSLLILVGIVLGAVAVAPAIGPPGLQPAGGNWPAGSPRQAALAAAACGIAAGWVITRLASGLVRTQRSRRSAGIGFGLPLLGSVLGWQMVTLVALVVVVVVVAVVAVTVSRAGRRLGGTAALPGLVLATLATLALAFQGPLWAALARVLGVRPGL
jgi:leader peptidase (prepilin peptidase) / N-methyltransferase